MDKIKKGSTYSVLGWITFYVSEVIVGGYPTRIKIVTRYKTNNWFTLRNIKLNTLIERDFLFNESKMFDYNIPKW